MTNAASASNSSNNNPRIPVDVAGFQYNFCKNPNCTQFGLPASQNKNHGNNTYNRTGSNKAGGINLPLLRCNACGEHLPMKSNEGIVQKIERIGSYLVGEVVYCTNDTPDPTTGEICSNYINKVPVGTKKAYRVHGKTNSGAKRYICKCGKTVSVAKPNQWQRETHNNTDIFKLLMNKMPLSRIINVLGISWEVLYNRIDFIHKQCLAFAAHRESKLQEKFIRRLYVSVDRQEYAVNWTERKDKRNVILTAVASSCNKTSYVFGVHPYFDGKVDKFTVEADASNINDAANTPPFRKYARLWLDADYEASVKKTKYKNVAGSLDQAIENTYSIMAQREDVEAFDEKNKNQKLPSFGVQTHAEYTMIAHFHFLKKLLGNVEKWRFFLDQDSGIRAACISAFVDEVKSKTMEAFYVRIEKGLTVDEKRKLKAEVQRFLMHSKLQIPRTLLKTSKSRCSVMRSQKCSRKATTRIVG